MQPTQALQCHPDRHSSGTEEERAAAEKKFKELGEVWNTHARTPSPSSSHLPEPSPALSLLPTPSHTSSRLRRRSRCCLLLSVTVCYCLLLSVTVCQAFEVLSDQQKRQRWDAGESLDEINGNGGGGGGHRVDPHDIFRMYTGGGGFGGGGFQGF